MENVSNYGRESSTEEYRLRKKLLSTEISVRRIAERNLKIFEYFECSFGCSEIK